MHRQRAVHTGRGCARYPLRMCVVQLRPGRQCIKVTVDAFVCVVCIVSCVTPLFILFLHNSRDFEYASQHTASTHSFQSPSPRFKVLVMSRRSKSDKGGEEEPGIELKVVLVDKSFRRTVGNGDVRLSLVSVVVRPSEKIASLKATLRRFAQRTVLSIYYRGVRCSPSRSVDYYRGLGSDGLWQGRLMEAIDTGQPRIALDINNDSKKIVLMVTSPISHHLYD